ncbi:MAG TPA: hypothetical protein VGA76_08430 [Candidatus Dormibacteraeota bacterium]
MSWSFVRREWGAVTFVLTVLVGMVVVPVALFFTNVAPSPVLGPAITTASSARASGVSSPTPTPTPTKSP